jgi:trehalose 6-phosphate phosphatase
MSLERAPEIDICSDALFLDLDGTLAPFEIDPAAVAPERRRSAILRRLNILLDGRLAIVSGRRIADIDRILDGQVFAAAGAHGLERRTAGSRFEAEPHPGVAQAQAALLALAAEHPDLLVEMKGLGVALHYRSRPELAERLSPTVAGLSNTLGLAFQAGDHVFELRTPGADKGDAIYAFMAESPFAGARPVYVGDDLSDESAFRAVRALGGFGVIVGTRKPTAARYRLASVEAVLDWLDDLTPTAVEPARRRAVANV